MPSPHIVRLVFHHFLSGEEKVQVGMSLENSGPVGNFLQFFMDNQYTAHLSSHMPLFPMRMYFYKLDGGYGFTMAPLTMVHEHGEAAKRCIAARFSPNGSLEKLFYHNPGEDGVSFELWPNNPAPEHEIDYRNEIYHVFDAMENYISTLRIYAVAKSNTEKYYTSLDSEAGSSIFER